METRFVVPVIVSTAFHALVLLLGNGPHAPGNPPVVTPVANPTGITFTPPPEDPDPVPPTDEASAPVKGVPDVGRPSLDEPWGKIPLDAIPFNPAPVRPDTGLANRISDLPVGDPNGVIDGKIGPKVVGANLLDATPRTRVRVAPEYPREAKTSGLTGEVLVEFVVDESGRVLHPRVVRSSDYRFEAPTLRAVERWRFEPGKKDGLTVRFRMAVPVMFTLEN
jgi:protein TonB